RRTRSAPAITSRAKRPSPNWCRCCKRWPVAQARSRPRSFRGADVQQTASLNPTHATPHDGWKALPASYAIPEQAPSLSEARAYCERLARTHYENFSVATWFLPRRLRHHFFNLYAYCRISDDLGDEVGDPAQSLALLDEWEAELGRCYQGGP